MPAAPRVVLPTSRRPDAPRRSTRGHEGIPRRTGPASSGAFASLGCAAHQQPFSSRAASCSRMSVRSDVGVCRACGVVQLARDMVRMAAYAYACRDCAGGREGAP